LSDRCHLKKWEIALFLAVGVTLFYSLVFGELSCCAWWGVIYPELTEPVACSAAALPGANGVLLRFRVAEWFTALLELLR